MLMYRYSQVYKKTLWIPSQSVSLQSFSSKTLYKSIIFRAAHALLFQFLLAGWLTGYSLRCQPVDYSEGGTRVSAFYYQSLNIEVLDETLNEDIKFIYSYQS